MQLEVARPKGKRLLCALRLLQGWDTDACKHASYRPHGTATAGLQWYHRRTHQHRCGLRRAREYTVRLYSSTVCSAALNKALLLNNAA